MCTFCIIIIVLTIFQISHLAIATVIQCKILD